MHFADNPKELIQSTVYERIVLACMNESKYVFPDTYFYIEQQSNGEPDFISNKEEKFDAKLLFSQEQCYYLSKGTYELKKWIFAVRKELGEASNQLMRRGAHNIHETKLYKEMLRRLPDAGIDENTIYFTPYPIVPESKRSVFSQFACDIISNTFNALLKDYPDRFVSNSCFIIYPSVLDNEIVVRKLGQYQKEYLPITPLSPYVTYSIEDRPEDDAGIIIY